MDRETLAQALEYADLTAYQADAYLTLLEMGFSPAIEVGRESSVPVSQIYDVLRSLESKGYVETIERETLHVRPREPDEPMGNLESRGQLLHDAAEEIKERYRKPRRLDARIGVTKRVETAVENAQELIGEAKTVVEVAGTYEQLQLLEPALRDAHDRGVVTHASIYTDDRQTAPEAFAPEGALSELRACTIPGPFLVVIDRHRTCFAPNTRSDEDYGVLIYDRILPFVFHWYYLTCLWDPYPQLYLEDEGKFTYVTMEEFVRDCYPLWSEGYDLSVVVEGVDMESESMTTVEGVVSEIQYYGRQQSRPALSDLSSHKIITLETDGETLAIGGWGAVFEDIEARTISLVGIESRDALPPRE